MGGGISHTLPTFRWTFLKRDDSYQIYQSETGLLAEKHVVEIDPKLNEQEELQGYYYRYSSQKPIVKAYKADFEARSEYCSNFKHMVVFTEYMPFRLAEIKNLTHEQGLYVLSEALIGFYELYHRLAAFAVDQTLIGFNQEGKVRVWHSPNFAQNHFDINSIVLMSTKNPKDFDRRLRQTQEQEMVDNIWTAIARYTTFNPEFAYLMESMQKFDFKTVKRYVDAQINRLAYVPSRLRFQDKFGILEQSKTLGDSSKISRKVNSLMLYRSALNN